MKQKKKAAKKGPSTSKKMRPMGEGIDQYELAERLRYFRTRRDLTQSQLAKKAEVNQSTIAQIEGGKKDPSISTLRKISIALDVHLATLFAGTDVHVFDMNRLRIRYDSVDKLNDTLYAALGKVLRYAKDIGFTP